MNKYRKFAAVVGIVVCLMLAVGATAARADSEGVGTVTASALNIRSEASASAAIVACPPQGTKVLVTGDSGDWYQVYYDGHSGYMSKEYLDFSESGDIALGTGTVTGNDVCVRSGAGTSNDILGGVNKGDTLSVTGVSSGWFKVSYNGSAGYISSAYVSLGSAGTNTGSEASPASESQTSSETGTVTGNYVRIRSGAGTTYPILGQVSTGDTLTVTDSSGDWFKVSYQGSTGYISGKYVSLGSSPQTSTQSETSETGRIQGTYVRMRSGPGTNYSILGTYDTGTEMTVTGTDGDWYKVRYNGTDGYVYKAYLTTGGESGSQSGSETSVTSMDDTAATVISAVHFRTGPDASYESRRVLEAGTSVTITGYTDKWYRATYDGAEGYIFKTYLSTGTASSGAVSTEGERLVAEAKRYLGVPYVYGGTSPSGFDCSGFVYYVYRQCGYSITRTATAQNGNGVYVSRDALQPGDIIIFYNGAMSGIGHAGMYVGDGQFIHASSGSGRVVISSLSETYYNSHYYSARRVV